MSPEVKVGQVWRRKKNGRHIVIVRENRMFGASDDWVWRGLDYKGHGYSYGSYIQRDCELVAESVEEFNRG